MVEPLSDHQIRVLASLAEKAATVPDTYPMTRRGLQAACNQRTSREPVTDLDEDTVQRALDELKRRGLVRFVYASHGARTTRYRHVLDEQLDLDAGELALLTVLMLRGPQTLGELRTRAERAHAFAGDDEVATTLEGLAGRAEPLVVHLARRPGQKETRWMHLLGGGEPVAQTESAEVERTPDDTARTVRSSATPSAAPTVDTSQPGLEARVAELEARVAALEARQSADEEAPAT